MTEQRFSQIYATNRWRHGSGEGSLVSQTRGYRQFLQAFLELKQIRSVVDMGCGDWQFSRLIDWDGIRYQGYDLVRPVIARNKDAFSAENISFICYAGNPDELPPADLLIVKDVLQHLPNQAIRDFMPSLSRFKYALITNCINPKGKSDNANIVAGDFRYLDLRLPPFNLDATPVYEFEKSEIGLVASLKRRFKGYPAWKKVVLMVDNRETSQS